MRAMNWQAGVQLSAMRGRYIIWVSGCYGWALWNVIQVYGCHRRGLESGNRRTLWRVSGQMLGWVLQNMDIE